MGKDKDKGKDKGKVKDGSNGHSKPTSSYSSSTAQKSLAAAAANEPKLKPNPNPKSTHTGEVHTDPKAAPQAPMGPVLQTAVSTDLHPEQPTPNDNFVIPKKHKKDKRARSLSSKPSENSTKAPPAKKSYADMAKGKDNQPADVWSEYQLQIYQTNLYHRKISFEDFLEVRKKVFKHAAAYLRQKPHQISVIKTTATYYNKTLNCGVFNCAHEQALTWFKTTNATVYGESYRGWSKSEQVMTFIKIFVPPGFEDTSAEDYLIATRILFETDDTKGIPWEIVKFYTHHTKHTHIIIAAIPTLIFKQIKSQGVETSKGSGVWKTEGFLAPLKLTLATPNDLKSSRSATKPNPATPPSESSDSESITNKVVFYNDATLSFELDNPKDNPLLSLPSMSSPVQAVELEDVNEVAEEVVIEGQEGGEDQNMDFSILNPDPADTEDFCGNWADQMMH
jgi:hypothetical protein